jgi:hypothetical protein
MKKPSSETDATRLNSYILQGEIGHGASGTCYRALSKLDGVVYAIKEISINTIKVPVGEIRGTTSSLPRRRWKC